MTTETASQETSAQAALSDAEAFGAGFNSATSGNDTFVDTTQEEAPADGTAQEPAGESSPVATAQEDLAAKIARLETALSQTTDALTQATNRLRTVEGRTGQLSGDFKQIRTRLESQPTTASAPATAAPTSALAKLKDEYPEIAAAIEEVAPAKPVAETQPAETAQVDPVMQHNYDVVESEHPGWRNTINAPQFRQWIDAQPLNVQMRIEEMANSNNPLHAIRVLNAYKQTAARPAAQPAPQPAANTGTPNRQRLRQAAAPGSRAAGGDNALSDDDAFSAGFNAVRGSNQ